MLIYLRSGQSTHTYEAQINQKIQEIADFFNAQVLQYGGRALRNELTLEQSGVFPNATLEISEALLGGKRKKKKKTYTTPKRKPHKKRKVRLPLLNILKVDKNEKVTKTRMACEKCGPGVFLAKHPNRHYCGKCHATILF